MRISDAIMLGSTIIRPLAGSHLSKDGSQGCAWGMANVATSNKEFQTLITAALGTKISIPCGCTGLIIGSGMKRYYAEEMGNLAYVIVHLFNDHVMTRKDWTLECLVDWVRSVEPADGEPVQLAPADTEIVDNLMYAVKSLA